MGGARTHDLGLDGAVEASVDAALPDGAVDAAGPPDGPSTDGPAPDLPCVPSDEICNGADDDCDDHVDEGDACGPYVASHCRVWLGWADLHEAPHEPAAAWGGCPEAERDERGDNRCVGTRLDGWFRRLPLRGNVDENDWLGVAFTCADDDRPQLAAWVQSRCAIALAQADHSRDPTALDPRGCPPAEVADDGGPDPRCVQSGGDGLFHPMRLRGDVNHDDALALALWCDDAVDPDRAAALQAASEAFLGSQDRQVLGFASCWDAPHDDGPAWGDCPASSADDAGLLRCVGTHGDGAFHAFHFDHDAARCEVLAVALRSR